MEKIVNFSILKGLIQSTITDLVFNGFKVTLFKKRIDDLSGNKDKVTDNQRKIIDSILRNSKISTNHLADEVGISQRKIKENINKLKEMGILQRIGPAKGAHWEII